MLDDAKTILSRLRKLFAAAAEKAYSDRAAESSGKRESYFSGEGHAYGIAEEELRKAEKSTEPPDSD